MEYAKTTTALHFRVNPSEQVIGWFATGAEITDTSVLIHSYYSSLTKNPPVHLTVDTTMKESDARMGIKAYLGVSFGVPNKTIGTMFPPCKVEIHGYEEEMVALRLCKRTQNSRQNQGVALPSELATVIESCAEMRSMLKTVMA